MNQKSSAGRVRPMVARIAITSALALAPIAAVAGPALADATDTQGPAIVQVDQAEDIHGRPGHHGHGGWGRGGWGGGGWGGHHSQPGYPSYPGYGFGLPGYFPRPSTGSAF
ncbi:hypothetical protein OG563_22730 [Nocardia vinacea]|uniref:Uncharacterized protein n=1 Tax=Nocardia vinacea TaxID=96468 RepID=A0ABZ1Z675_9NOCA|nr:hypothetical protein [Nocardia vinacea]